MNAIRCPFDPCGLVVAFATRCGRYWLKPWADSEETIPVRTYPAKAGAPAIPLWHAFNLPEWFPFDDEPDPGPGQIGFLRGRRGSAKQDAPFWGPNGTKFCGRPAGWLEGFRTDTDPPLVWNDAFMSTCCAAGRPTPVNVLGLDPAIPLPLRLTAAIGDTPGTERVPLTLTVRSEVGGPSYSPALPLTLALTSETGTTGLTPSVPLGLDLAATVGGESYPPPTGEPDMLGTLAIPPVATTNPSAVEILPSRWYVVTVTSPSSITLPPPVEGITVGITITPGSTSSLTVTAPVGSTVEGSSSFVMNRGGVVVLVCDGTGWFFATQRLGVPPGTVLGRGELSGQGPPEVLGADQSVKVDGTNVRLVNDALTPGNRKSYATGATGLKGWQDPAGPPPAAPTGLAATPGNASVSLTWTAPAGAPPAASYRVYRSTASTMAGAVLIGEPTTNSFSATGLTNGTPYYFQVAAVSDSGAAGPASSVATATPSAVTTTLYDQFTDADGTNLTAHAMNTGSGWTVLSGASRIRTNRAQAGTTGTGGTSGTLLARATNSSANGTAEAVFHAGTSGNTRMALAFRITDANNYWRFQVDTNAFPGWSLIKVVSGSPTVVGTYAGAFLGDGSETAKVTLTGSSIECRINTTLAVSVTDSAHVGATGFGLYAFNDGSTYGWPASFDEFEVTS